MNNPSSQGSNISCLEDIGPLCVSQKVNSRDLNFFSDSCPEKSKPAKITKTKKQESCLMKDSQVAMIKKVKPTNKTRKLLKNDDAEFKQVMTFALQKEGKVKEKIEFMMTHVQKNNSLSKEWFQHQTAELDQYFEEIRNNLVILVTQTIDQERNKLQENLKNDFQDYSQDSRHLNSLFKNVLETNSFTKTLDQAKSKALANPNLNHFEEILNGYIANSCDLQFGFTPLVKKYHLLKDSVPSFDPLIHLQERFIINKTVLMSESQEALNEIARALGKLNSSVHSRIKRLTNPLKPFVEALEIYSKIPDSILPEDLFVPISDAEIDLDSFKEPNTPKEVTYCLDAETKKTLLEKKLIINTQDLCEISYDVRAFSTQDDMKKGVFISHNGIPYKIQALDWVFPSHYVELENALTGNKERIQFHSRWHQIPFTIIPKKYTIVKSKENKQYFIVFSQHEGEPVFSLIQKKNIISEELAQEIDKKIKEGGEKVEVVTIKLNDQDLIIDIN